MQESAAGLSLRRQAPVSEPSGRLGPRRPEPGRSRSRHETEKDTGEMSPPHSRQLRRRLWWEPSRSTLPRPLGSGPVACRAWGARQRGTDTQTHVLTLHGYCRTEGEQRLKKLSEKGKKEKQY